jgi:hypothetical protein
MKIHSPVQTCHFQLYTLTTKLIHAYFHTVHCQHDKKNKLLLSKFIDSYAHA